MEGPTIQGAIPVTVPKRLRGVRTPLHRQKVEKEATNRPLKKLCFPEPYKKQTLQFTCELLHQVLARTSTEEDKRKLEAIRRTYTSRIEELDQMAPIQVPDGKALPARPESLGLRLNPTLQFNDDDDVDYLEEPGGLETAALARILKDGGRNSPSYAGPGLPISRMQGLAEPARSGLSRTPEQYTLQSSFSRSPLRERNSDEHLIFQIPTEDATMPPPLSPRRPTSPELDGRGSPDGPVRSDFSLSATRTGQAPKHVRDSSRESNSWLDPIDESGGSTSSVHSRSSSMNVRRKHIRAPSGATEAEFDAALDAAVEAAYDDGYEPMDLSDTEAYASDDQVVAKALRKVELAKERVRQTEREVYEQESERERRVQGQQKPDGDLIHEDFYDDGSSDEEERILEEMTRGYSIDDFSFNQAPRSSAARHSGSSDAQQTWQMPGTHGTNGDDVSSSPTDVFPSSNFPRAGSPAAPPPVQSLPELPSKTSFSGPVPGPGQTVRSRRMSGQNPKQLKIETSKLSKYGDPGRRYSVAQSIDNDQGVDFDRRDSIISNDFNGGMRRPYSPPEGISPTQPVPPTPPPGHRSRDSADFNSHSGSPSFRPTLRKNFSSSSLRSMKNRNMSLSNLEDASDMSPGTPMSNAFGISGRHPAMPALPTPLAAAFRDKFTSGSAGGLYLFDDTLHSPQSPGSPNSLQVDAPVPLEPCPTDYMLRPFWLMRCLYQTLAHPRGGYLSNKLFVPRDVWKVKGVKIRNVEDKVATCDYLTAALLKLARVDTCDADAVLEEMQALEVILEQVQASLTRKLGTEVGVQSSNVIFRDASNSVEIEAAINVPRSASVSGKSSSFSWRRLRSKGSAAGLNSSYNAKGTGPDSGKESPVLETLPMTENPTSRPTKRDPTSAQFTGPNSNYMGSLARLFDAAQTIDQIARQVEDPGLRHADKTQVGLELSPWSRSLGSSWNPVRSQPFHCATAHLAKPAPPSRAAQALEERILSIPIERYRNFCIVAHIDHGKSTLSDRLLEITGTISASDANKQILDKLDVERERGITVKAQTCTMIYNYKEEDYLLHLVDTPGHVDFRAEVTRSYASCGGALLLVDASQGIQAQTVSNFHLAFAQDLALIPVVNKIDMPSADVSRVLDQMHTSFELDPSSAVLVSAKTGKNVPNILPAVVEQIPHPVGDTSKPLRMLLVDSWYDNFRGVILLVRVFDGQVKAGDNLISFATGQKYTVGEVGIQYPNAVPQSVLRAGQVGYIHFNPGMKRIQDAKLGDTFTTTGSEAVVEPYPGFEEPKPMVFVAAFPTDQSDYTRLADSISQLVLNDRSVTLQKDYSEALGAGWRLGFLGSLHCSVFQDRLKQEHGASIIITDPTVPTKVGWADGSETIYQNPAEFPSQDEHRMRGATAYEPFVTATITLPEEYLGRVIELCESQRGEQKSLEFFHTTQVILKYDIPAAQLVDDLFGKLKGVTKGYASLDYEEAGWRASQLTKLQLLVNKQPVDAICRVIHTSQAERLGRQWVTKFKEHVDRQMFEVVIQAVAGRRIVARETIKPFRKDVLAKLHASDITRRKKLLEKQKAGRKRLRAVGNVIIDQSAFQSFLAR
ncbi:Translation factor GUF1 [Colletotrichum siamense]|uniref:Translation factor GUF1 n=2 Tax=Colletotrichum gloeosporioides species complex TaxID=2707338 RepID=A0A9P5BMD9_COLSI|nr:Translation factor GUF1 [Colletotrichum siamense]KAF4841553.1 Translation factor GUF1 [Colletotrichum siamense]